MLYPTKISWEVHEDGVERVHFSAKTVLGECHSGFGASDGSEDFSEL
jgi:hypothetical protein